MAVSADQREDLAPVITGIGTQFRAIDCQPQPAIHDHAIRFAPELDPALPNRSNQKVGVRLSRENGMSFPITPIECAEARQLFDLGGNRSEGFQRSARSRLRGCSASPTESCKIKMPGRPPQHRHRAWSLASVLAMAAIASALDGSANSVFAQTNGTRTTTAEKMVHLNHLSTPWTKVLENLAKGTDSTLVMQAEPPGKYSRHDWKKHTRTEAVRILNRDLEKNGYRILEKGEFLTVIEIQQVHQDYERPVVGERRPTLAPDTAPGIQVVGHEEPAELVVRRDPLIRPVPREQSATGPHVRASRPLTDQRVRPIQHTEEVQPGQPAAIQTANQPPLAIEAPMTALTVPLTQRKATEIAKQLHTAFGARSQLMEEGPHGLPAFQVSESVTPQAAEGTVPSPQFTVEVDAAKNELYVTASATTAGTVENLIRMLDKNTLPRGQRQAVVAGDAALVAEKLQPQLSQLVQERRQIPDRAAKIRGQALAQAGVPGEEAGPEVDSPEALFNRTNQSTTEAEGPQPGAMSEEGSGNQSPQDQLPALLDTLKGDVTIESMPDLDLLILRGNEKDIEAVMRVINTIEMMAEGSTPEIHLRRLEHVDSQSLATLLTQVYERMTTLRGSTAQKSDAQVSVIPVVTPNAVLILAPANALDSILKLTEELDQNVDPSHQVEVFPLENAIASQVVTTLEEFYPDDATARPGLSTRIRISADARTNSVIVQAQPRDMNEVREVIKRIDRDEAGAVAQARIVKLKSANAEELATFLQQALQSIITGQTATGQGGNAGGNGGQNAQQLRETKSVVLEFLAHDRMAQELVRSGLLTDVRVNADARTNTLMITAPKQSMGFMEELVRVLDQPSSAVAEIKVFTLRNADAADAVELLETLFVEETNNQNGAIGVQLAGASDPGSNLVPLKFSTDGRTNSVVAIGGGDALRIVEAVLLRLDDNDARTRKTTVIKLRNNPAEDVSVAINQYLQSQRDLAQIDPDRISSSQLLEQEVIVTPEPLSNSLIISATPRYHDEIMNLTSELDREPHQVAIQALLVEVTLEDNDEFGVELGFQDSVLFDRSVIDNILTIAETTTAPNGVQTTTNRVISQSSTPGFPFNNLPLGNNTSVHPGKVGSQGLSSFSLGRTNSELGYGGMVLSASSDSVNVLVRALAARRNVRVLSRPSITVMDNQIAEIQVGQVVPVTDGATIGANGNVVPTITRDNAGIILTVTPRISQDGQVVMEVAAEKSQYTGEGVTILTDSNGGEVTSPVKDIATASTTVKVQDSQTIVLGGMITNSNDDIERKVPWLGDIPVVGQLFRFDSHAHRRTELLIFLTPRVIRNGIDAENIKQIESQRIHYFEDEAELIHGPIFGVPAEDPLLESTMPIEVETLEPTPAPPPPIENFEQQPIQQMSGVSTPQAPSRTRSFFKKKGTATSSR